MGRGKKKVTYTYSSNEEAKEVSALEDFLFGGGGRQLLVTADEAAGGAAHSINELVKQAAAAAPGSDDADGEADDDLLNFVVDRAGDEQQQEEHEDLLQQQQQQQQQDSDDEAEAEDEDAGRGDNHAEGVEGGGVDRGAAGAAGPGPGSMALQEQQQQLHAKKGSKRGRAPVWSDPADANLSVPVAAVARLRKLRNFKGQTEMSGNQYEEALRRQHTILNPRTTWATTSKKPAAGSAAAAAAAGGRDEDDYVIDDEAEPDESSVEQLLLSGSGVVLGGGGGAAGGLLAPGVIEMSRLRDANGSSPCEAVVQALQWHPNAQLMLTAGFDKRIRLFQVDGLRNPLVQSLYLEDCPIQTASFAAGGSCIVAAGRRPFYYVADLNTGQLERVVAPPCLNLAPSGTRSTTPLNPHPPAAKKHKGGRPAGAAGGNGRGPGSKGGIGMKSCESFVASGDPSRPLVAFLGDNGHIGLVSLSSRTAVGSLKMNGSARAAAFSSDGRTLITAGGDGVLYTWDLRSQRCLHRQRDEGVVSCTSLALAPDGSYLATGDSMGVVNIYSRPAGLLTPLDLNAGAQQGSAATTAAGFGVQPPSGPAPLKSLMNLTTTIDSLAFSHDSQLLMMGSRMKREGLRLVHLPSLSVYSNWPTTRSPLQYVHCAAFSPHSGFLGIGNAKGRVLLYRVHHYSSV